MIKSCSNCGRSVSIFTKVGDSCPHCGAIFSYERRTSGSYGSSSYSTKGCLKLVIIILIVAVVLTLPMTFLRRFNEKNIQTICNQLQTGDDATLAAAVEKWMSFTQESRHRITDMYLTKLINSSGLEKEKLILRLQKIAKLMKENMKDGEDLMNTFPYEFYENLQIMQNDSNTTIRNAAVQTLDSLSVFSGKKFSEFSY